MTDVPLRYADGAGAVQVELVESLLESGNLPWVSGSINWDKPGVTCLLDSRYRDFRGLGCI